MKVYLILNCVIAFVGAFLFFHIRQAGQKEEISDYLIPKEEISKCRNKKEFIQMVYPKTMLFGGVMAVIGVIGVFVEAGFLKIPYWQYIELATFLVFLVIFWKAYTDGKSKYFS